MLDEFGLCSLLSKVCQTLSNRSRDVRDVARDTLVRMAKALGPRFLHYVITEMEGTLTRGYQVSQAENNQIGESCFDLKRALGVVMHCYTGKKCVMA